MQPSNTRAADITERIMAELLKRDVLKADERDRPHHYNLTWSAVYEILDPLFPGQMTTPTQGPVPKGFYDGILKRPEWLDRMGG
jgi:hypothetical protein